MKPLTRMKLDALPCACCGDPAHNAQPMFLHPACHPGHGVKVESNDGVMSVCCSKCSKFVVSLEIADGAEKDNGQVRSTCHPSSHVNVEYFDGVATVRCKSCDGSVIKFEIADGEDAPLLN